MQTLKDQLTKVLGKTVFFAEKMYKHTTIKIGGSADILVLADDIDTIIKTMKLALEKNLDVSIIGNGSNLIVSDQGIRGIVIKIYSSEQKPIVDGQKVNVFSGFPLGKLINFTIQEGLGGLEGLVGIPGSFGGALTMNAGTGTTEIGHMINWVKVLNKKTLEVETIPKEEMGFSYRKSIIQNGCHVILEAQLQLMRGSSRDLKTTKNEIIKKRNKKQPVQFPNSGSIFKNPPNDSAGRLIEATGLKGYTIGDAQISEQHANFIVNIGQAKASEVVELMNVARKEVNKKFSLVLQPEVKFMGGGLKLEEV